MQKVCAFLEVSTDRLKIVGVRDGAAGKRILAGQNIVEINAILDGNTTFDPTNNNATAN